MKISLDFLNAIVQHNNIKIYEVPVGHYTFEYAQQHYLEGIVMGAIEIENEIINELNDNVIGYFGINFEHNIMAYYLKT